MRYRPEIDGLRAFAVVPVLLFHGKVPGFPGGYVGVDVFFVISGYLIASILLDDLDKKRFSLARFYERRARRILPALIFVILFTTVFAWFWMLPSELAEFGKSIAAVALFASNILFWRQIGYFRPSTELNPMLHTWSLAVEEQFYLLFPVALFLIWRFWRRGLIPITVAVLVVSLALAQWATVDAPVAGFYLAPTRFWELLAGVLAAMVLRRNVLPKSQIAGLLGIVLICGSVVFFTPETPMPSLWTVLPVGGAVLIVFFGQQGSIAAQILSWRPFVGIGLISYSVYLFHQPLLALARLRLAPELHMSTVAGLYAATFALAWFSWRFVELPMRRRGPGGMTTPKVLSVSLASLVALLVGGTLLNLSHGAPWRPGYANVAEVEEDLRPNHGLAEKCAEHGFTLSRDCKTSDNPTAVVWGDSYAMALIPALVTSPTKFDFVQQTYSSCGPFPGVANHSPKYPWDSCIAFNDQVLDWILNHAEISTVVMTSDYSELLGPLYYRNGANTTAPDEIKSALESSLIDTIGKLHDAGKSVVLVGPPPRNDTDLGRCYLHQYIYSGDFDLCDFYEKNISLLDRMAADLLADLGDVVPTVDLVPLICHDGICKTTLGGVNLYRDTGHLSIEGSRLFGERFDLAKILEAAASTWAQKPKPVLHAVNPSQ
ncbi:acyltransferase family protein [Thioclava pacifica]|uniref:Acyltransferase n=1 Tax=Thioclava pacifica DSM 10166 TaxID=1353537 RepID=A0A074JDW5_9RHOB|nr:acyltransferase family protein [Thioclava pacifica]KEO54709.1 hypothetical protein TP2_17390 [Thioclava pacifica DSM 10166]